MDSEGCFTRYCRNASPTRLLVYGIVALAVVVIVILLFTLWPSKSADGPTAGSQVLRLVPLVDGYNNLPSALMSQLNGDILNFPFEKNLAKDKAYTWCKTDLDRLRSGMVNTQVWTVTVPCPSQYKDAAARTLQQLDVMNRLIAKYKDDLTLVTKAEEIMRTFDERQKIGSLLAINGGHSIDTKLAVLRTYHSLGVRLIALTSNCDTPWAASYKTESSLFTLSEFGKAVIKEMNRLGIIIDVGQMGTDAQLAVIKESEAPVVISKVGAREVTVLDGNIEDKVLEKLTKKGGLVLIPFDGNVLKKDSIKGMKSAIDHINYIRKKLGSVDYIGLGAGFNSDDSCSKSVTDLEDSSVYPALFDRLSEPQKEEPKWTPDELKKLAGLNFVRVMDAVEKVSASKAGEKPDDRLIDINDIPASWRTTCYTGK